MHPVTARDRSQWLLIVAGVAALTYAAAYNTQYPIREWLLTRVVGYWALGSYFILGCLSIGVALVERVAPRQYRSTELAFVALPIGVLTFALTTFCVASVGGLGGGFFFIMPGLFALVGCRRTWLWLGRLRAIRSLRLYRPGPLDLLAFAFGATGILLVYVPILSTQNIQHDARWYHLPIAAQYAFSDGHALFPEGWFLAAYPHLSSLLYAWALLWPAPIVDRLELCAHLEFLLFLFTLASIPALVRRLVPGLRLPFSWAAFFLFPGLLVYDSNLSTGADHIAAIWAPGALLVFLAAIRTLSLRHASLLGALAGGAALTKYSALCVSIPILAFFTASAAVSLIRRRRVARKAVLAVLTAGLVFVLVWAPHWLKNWICYGDPLYPTLAGRLRAHPWNAYAAEYFRSFVENAVQRPRFNISGVLESIRVALTLGFDVHEYSFHGSVPTFGFLFAATLFCLPFVRPRRNMIICFALGLSATLVWFWTNHRDRYLQACLPWFVAATVSVLAVAFREFGRKGRFAAAGLVGVEVVFGAGVFLLPVHIMIPGGHPLPHVMNLVKAGYDKQYQARFEPYSDWGFADWTALGKELPKNSRVLVHEDRLWLGLDAPVVVDEAAWQAGIRYAALANAREVHDTLRGYGVTHVITGQDHPDGGSHGLAGEIVFWDFLTGYAREVGSHGKLTLWEMPPVRPEPLPIGNVLVFACRGDLRSGLYDLEGLHDQRAISEIDGEEVNPRVLASAEYVAIEAACSTTQDLHFLSQFHLIKKRSDFHFYRRKH